MHLAARRDIVVPNSRLQALVLLAGDQRDAGPAVRAPATAKVSALGTGSMHAARAIEAADFRAGRGVPVDAASPQAGAAAPGVEAPQGQAPEAALAVGAQKIKYANHPPILWPQKP